MHAHHERSRFHFAIKFEGFFLVGFFLLIFFALSKHYLVAGIGAFLMLLAFIVDYEKKRFLTRDIYMLGYALFTTLVVISFINVKLPSLFAGILGMLFSLLLYTLHKKKLLHEKHKQILKKHPQHKFVPTRAQKINLYLNANMWSLIAVIILIFASFLHHLLLLVLGLLAACTALTLHVIKIRALKRKWRDLSHKRVLDMKEDIKTRRSKYETDFDKLIRLVQKYHTVRISEIAHVFNITHEKAEEWGKILEEHGMVIVHFPPIGEAELQWK